MHNPYSMRRSPLSKRGSIPVTIFTVLALAVFVFALVSFALSARALVTKTLMPVTFVTQSAIEHRALVYADANAGGAFVREDRIMEGWLWWKKEVVKMIVGMGRN